MSAYCTNARSSTMPRSSSRRFSQDNACRRTRVTKVVVMAGGSAAAHTTYEGTRGLSKRRNVLIQGTGAAAALLTTLLTPSVGAALADEDPNIIGTLNADGTFVDTKQSYELKLSNEKGEWEQVNTRVPGNKNVTVFYLKDKPEVSVSVIVAGTSVEFTKMGAFGSPLEFALQNIVAPLDRAYLCKAPSNNKGPCLEPTAAVVDASDNAGIYQVTYTVEKPGPEGFDRTFFSAVGVGSNGVSQALFTLTAQVPNASKGEYDTMLKATAKSFKLLR